MAALCKFDDNGWVVEDEIHLQTEATYTLVVFTLLSASPLGETGMTWGGKTIRELEPDFFCDFMA